MNSFILILILTLISGLFAMSEMALTSARKVRLELSARRGNQGAIAALALSNSPNKFLSTIQIGITLISIVMGIVGGEAYAEKIAPYIAKVPFIGIYSYQISTALNIILVGFISIVFGEMIPKRIGLARPEAIAEFVAIPMTWIFRFARPFVWLLSLTTELVMRLLNVKTDESKVTEEEIKAIIDEGATAGTIEEIEQDIVERVFHLGDKRVGALMTNRSEIIWLDVNDDVDVNLEKIQHHSHAVYPVCDKELDDVVGIVSVKDVLLVHLRNEKLDFQNLIRKVNYFPESMSAYSALEKFKESRIHQGLVVDEYGSVVGIVTINDVFDALVGDISQDDEQISYTFLLREDGSWLIDGQYPWDDLLNEFDIDDERHIKEGFHTLGGFLLHELQAVPKEGESIIWNGFQFEVIDMDGMRIDKIILKRL
jgi:putative hemolysin